MLPASREPILLWAAAFFIDCSCFEVHSLGFGVVVRKCTEVPPLSARAGALMISRIHPDEVTCPFSVAGVAVLATRVGPMTASHKQGYP